jgi:hypothetical protein
MEIESAATAGHDRRDALDAMLRDCYADETLYLTYHPRPNAAYIAQNRAFRRRLIREIAALDASR